MLLVEHTGMHLPVKCLLVMTSRCVHSGFVTRRCCLISRCVTDSCMKSMNTCFPNHQTILFEKQGFMLFVQLLVAHLLIMQLLPFAGRWGTM